MDDGILILSKCAVKQFIGETDHKLTTGNGPNSGVRVFDRSRGIFGRAFPTPIGNEATHLCTASCIALTRMFHRVKPRCAGCGGCAAPSIPTRDDLTTAEPDCPGVAEGESVKAEPKAATDAFHPALSVAPPGLAHPSQRFQVCEYFTTTLRASDLGSHRPSWNRLVHIDSLKTT